MAASLRERQMAQSVEFGIKEIGDNLIEVITSKRADEQQDYADNHETEWLDQYSEGLRRFLTWGVSELATEIKERVDDYNDQ